MKKYLISLVLMLALVAAPFYAVVASSSTIPTFSIESVVVDSTVTIKTYNFPAHVVFTVRMGKIGTQGINGIVVTTTDSGSGGTFVESFAIPDALKGLAQISIRLENKSTGYFSYNWFFNNTTGATSTPAPSALPSGSTATPTPTSSYSGFPTFSIVSVVRDSSVTIQTYNLPPDKTFTVRMGEYGTRGIGGTVVTTTDSGSGGSQTLSYSIPSELKGDARIAIRMDEPSFGYFAYNWFFNNTTP